MLNQFIKEIQIPEGTGPNYGIGKLDVFKQMNVVRRIPLLVSFEEALKKVAEDKEPNFLLSIASPLLISTLHNLPDTEALYVIKTCLSVVMRQDANGQWAKVLAAPGDTNSQLMFQDIDLPSLMSLAFTVLQENVGSFFPSAAPPALTSAQVQASGS